jgi:hypothetical protein
MKNAADGLARLNPAVINFRTSWNDAEQDHQLWLPRDGLESESNVPRERDVVGTIMVCRK